MAEFDSCDSILRFERGFQMNRKEVIKWKPKRALALSHAGQGPFKAARVRCDRELLARPALRLVAEHGAAQREGYELRLPARASLAEDAPQLRT
jgi:hypothetical protein